MGSKITPFMRQCFVTTAVGLNIIGMGCGLGFPAILLPHLHEKNSEIPLTKEGESWIAATAALSMLIGTVLTLSIMDRFGRKATHYMLTILAIISWFITILATSVEALILGRFIFGMSAGMLLSLRSILIGEYTSPKNRGAFLTTVSLTQAFGIFFAHLLGSLISWQKTALVCLFSPFLSLVMIMYTPESPSWLVSKGRHDECREVFRWLRGSEEDEELEDMIEARIAYEQAIVKAPKDSHLLKKLSIIIRRGEFYKPILIMIYSNAMLHFSGGTTMASYSTVILSLLMGPKANVHFWMVFLDTQRVIFNTLAVYVINKTKRRIMVFSTGMWSAASHFAIAIYVYFRLNGWDYDAIWLPALLVNVQYLAVAVGTVPMPQVLGGEVFPLEYRGIGGFISMVTGNGVMFLALKTFPRLVDKSGLQGTYIVYGVIILINLILLMVLLPETKGKTLQQIEDEFRGRPLRREELESKQSLQANPIENYKRKMSSLSFGSSTIL
ncbi:unnamed protein product, partial [Brenthis ino]